MGLIVHPLGVFLAVKMLTDHIVAHRYPDYGEYPLFDQQIVQATVQHLHAVAATKKPFFIACGLHRPHLPFAVPSEFHDILPPTEEIKPPKYNRPPEVGPRLAAGALLSHLPSRWGHWCLDCAAAIYHSYGGRACAMTSEIDPHSIEHNTRTSLENTHIAATSLDGTIVPHFTSLVLGWDKNALRAHRWVGLCGMTVVFQLAMSAAQVVIVIVFLIR